VTTKRNFWLAAKSLRIVEDHRGNLEVALDPIGAKPGDFVFTIGGIIDHWDEERWRGDVPTAPQLHNQNTSDRRNLNGQ